MSELVHNVSDIMKKFNTCALNFTKKKTEEYKTLSGKEKKIFQGKYSFIKRKYKLPYYYELLKCNEIRDTFSEEEKCSITDILINKIQGIYKHSQCKKTWLCNIDIITHIKENLIICVTKNTLQANEQWTTRFIKDVKQTFPGTPLDKLILVLSSKKIHYMEMRHIVQKYQKLLTIYHHVIHFAYYLYALILHKY